MITIPTFGRFAPGLAATYRPSAYFLAFDQVRNLAVVRTPGGIYLPGGGVEPGETAEQAATREAREETGLIIDNLREIGRAIQYVFSTHKSIYIEKDCSFFVVAVIGRTRPCEADHVLVWLSPSEACAELKHESHRWALLRALSPVVANSYAALNCYISSDNESSSTMQRRR